MPSPMEGGHMRQSVQEWTKQNLWDIAFKKFEVTWFALTDISNFKFYFKSFKGCIPQILLGPLLNTLVHIKYLLLEIQRRIWLKWIFQLDWLDFHGKVSLRGNCALRMSPNFASNIPRLFSIVTKIIHKFSDDFRGNIS